MNDARKEVLKKAFNLMMEVVNGEGGDGGGIIYLWPNEFAEGRQLFDEERQKDSVFKDAVVEEMPDGVHYTRDQSSITLTSSFATFQQRSTWDLSIHI